MATDLYPPGLNHAELHQGTGDMPLIMGTLASPVDITTAGQYGYAIYLQGSATSGLMTGGRFDVQIGATGALSITAIRARAAAPGAYVSTGYMYGVHVELEILATAQIGAAGGYDVRGVAIEAYQVAATTIGGHIMSIYVSNYMLGTITGDYFMMYLAENGSVTITAWMHFLQGGSSDANYFISVAGTSSAWSPTGDKTGSSTGWFKCLTPGGIRYLQLYT